jgi:hypothetical protein
MKQSVLFYGALVLIVFGSVLFGLDWQSATMSPMPPIQVVAVVMPPLPPPPLAAPPHVQAASPAVAPGPASPAIPVTPNPVIPTIVVPAPVSAPVENNTAPVAQTPPKPLCDVTACAAAYRSFRESDCTYNPSAGPRRLCTKGVVPTGAAAPPNAPDVPGSIVAPEPGVNLPGSSPNNAHCNVSACAAAYRSFRQSDCTFNPSVGPRQICNK